MGWWMTLLPALSRFATAYANVSDAPLRSQEVIRRCIRAFPARLLIVSKI